MDRTDLKCHICELENMTHPEWVEHQHDEQHIKKIEIARIRQLFCKKCDVQCRFKAEYDKHCLTKRHLDGSLKMEDIFCNKCNIQCRSRTEWENHVKTYKHLKEKTEKVVKPKKERLKPEDIFCHKCETQCRTRPEWENHIKSNKHNKQETIIEYNCKKCEYTCGLKHLWDQHLKTKKHLHNNGETVPESVQQTSSEGIEIN